MTRPWAWAAELGVTRTGYRSLSPGAGLTGDWTRLAPDTDTRSSELTLSHPLLTRGTLIIDSCNEVSMASSGQWAGEGFLHAQTRPASYNMPGNSMDK